MESEIKMKCFTGAPCTVEKEFNDWIYEMKKNGKIDLVTTNQSYFSDNYGSKIAYSLIYEYTPNKRTIGGFDSRLIM
jgi:hypothetical protein